MRFIVSLFVVLFFVQAIFGQPINLEEVSELGEEHHSGKTQLLSFKHNE